MLATDQPLPILNDKPLEGIVKESEFAAGKDAKEVTVKIPEDCLEVEGSRFVRFWRDHAPQHFS